MEIKTTRDKKNNDWEHVFTVNNVEVTMNSVDRGGFCFDTIETDNLRINGEHWYGDGDRLPGRVCFSVVVKKDNKEEIIKLETAYKNAEDRWDDLESRKEDCTKDDRSTWPTEKECGHNFESTDMGDDYDPYEDALSIYASMIEEAGFEMDEAEFEMDEAKEDQWEDCQVDVDLWGGHSTGNWCDISARIECDEDLGDGEEIIVEIAEHIREACYRIYSEKREC